MRMKKLLSLLLALVMVLSLVPTTVFATEGEKVYISVSYDGQYVNDKNGGYIAYVPVSFDEVASIDLEEYGLGDYLYDEDGDGIYETTALQLVIYAHENLYGGSWSDVTFTGSAGSSYFQGGIFGFDENLNYYLNGEYPLAGEGWGATSDQIVLEAGDFLDIASFSSWDFYMDSNYGFHFFADENGTFTHDYTVEAGTVLPVKLVRSFSAMGVEAAVYDGADHTVYYGTSLYASDAATVTTDGSGCAEITFDAADTYYLWADGGYGSEYPDSVVSSPAYAKVTVTAAAAPEQPREAQSVTTQLNATMAQMAATVTAPVFGTTAGEWTVLSLARGGYYAKDNAYFTDYYNRIVETVNTTATSVNMSGALHKNKSTENSRLIVALSALGKDATAVGNWDLVEAYSANGFSWIKKQGLNGTIWALIALDSNNYATSDTTIRQQCVDAIVDAQHDDGGWSLMANKTYASDPDVTGMALTALYPYRDQQGVAEVCAEAIACLSAMQHDNGTFESGGSECAESCAWVIVATTMWGINPDTDSRFIKNGNSVVDGLLAHYLSDSATFQHIIGAGTNAMATDQSCYALVAYDRFINNEKALFDYSDVTFDAKTEVVAGKPKITLGLPKEVANDVGTTFNANVSIDQWGSGYKLLDMVMTVPAGLKVNAVTATRLDGGSMSYHLDSDGKLRLVYFDEKENKDITITKNANGNTFPAEMFTIEFEVEALLEAETLLEITIDGMSLKTSSDSTDEESMTVVDISAASGKIKVVEGISYSAKQLYKGDGIDLIASDKMAVAVAVTGLDKDAAAPKLTFKNGESEVVLLYSAEMHAKSGVHTYVALVDASIAMEKFTDEKNFTLEEKSVSAALTFGDSNADRTINAQDALNAVNFWLRKEAPTDHQILTANVNGDSRLNTYDALGIVEHFVNNSEFTVVTMALSLKVETNNQ